MNPNSPVLPEKRNSVHALEATNFFLADVQTGLGPFLAAYLAGAGGDPGRVGMALTVGGIITVALQAPAGAIVDQLRSSMSEVCYQKWRTTPAESRKLFWRLLSPLERCVRK
jgi:hypothetical protein